MKKTQKSTEQIKLMAQERSITGKKVKKLRKEGMLPANIYGTDFKSTSISVLYKDFKNVYKIVHETGIVYLQLDKKDIPSMVKHIQRHPIDSTVLHVDFRKIDLAKKVETEVPVKVIGSSEAVVQKNGILLTQSTHLTVEALPQDIPASIDVDISTLKELGQDIKVGDLAKSKSYTITTDPEKVIVSVTAHKEESTVTETTATAAPEVITAKPDEEEAADEGGKEEGKKQTEEKKPVEKEKKE
ncbi:MAG: 50S ribosomal protein L25 [Patescibacteria group bacterium]